MANWIFTTKIPSEDFEELLTSKRWPIKTTTRYRNFLAPKDNVIFYRGIPYGKKFVCSCILTSKPIWSDKENYLKFSNVKKWKNAVPIENHLDKLEFIRSTKKWQIYLMGGIIRLSEKDFKTIISLSESLTK